MTTRRKIGTRIHKQSQKVATIYRLPETREYMVAFEGNPAADYFTDCQNDAYGTAEHWCAGMQSMGAPAQEENSMRT